MKNKVSALFLISLISACSLTLPVFSDEGADIKERYSVYYNNGVNLYKEKKYNDAINEFKKVLRFVPYDVNVKNALYTAYISRADYALNTEKQPKKAILDLKSALFYMKYWDEGNKGVDSNKVTSTESSLNQLLKKYQNYNDDTLYQNAKNLRASGEMAASAYDFNKIKNNSKYTYNVLLTLSDIYKSLNNQHMALENIRKASKMKPEDGMAHYKYAIILDDIKNFDAANEEYALALKYANSEVLGSLKGLYEARSLNNPKNVENIINLGVVYQKMGQPEAAKAQYVKAQTLDPKNPLVLSNLASLYMENKDYNSALDIYTIMAQNNPKAPEPVLYRANAYKLMGDNNAAIKEYKRVLALSPNNEEAKAGIETIVSNLKGADLISYLTAEVESDPYNYDKQFNLAYELHKDKQYQKAVAHYKKAIAINSKLAEPYINIAQIYRLTGDTAKAEAAISHGLSNLPDNKELKNLKNDIVAEVSGNLYNSATKYFNDGDFKTALEYYKKIELQTPEVLYSIASCYFEMKDNEHAIEYFKKVLNKNPKDTKAMYFTANAYLNLKNTDSAIEYLNKILAIEPENQDAKSALAAINQGNEGRELDMAISFYEQKKYPESLSLIEKILSKNPKNAYALYYKGAIYDDTNRRDEAIGAYKQAISADSKFSLAYYMLGVALDAKEDYKAALTYYEGFLSLKAGDSVEDDFVKYVKGRVKELKEYLNAK